VRNAENRGQTRIKFPELKHPEFHGLFHKWGDFKRDFDELVGMKDDAKLIESEEDSFDSLWNALTNTNTYENQRFMTNRCIGSIMNEKSMSRGSPAELKALKV
jgi:hypothetical protein